MNIVKVERTLFQHDVPAKKLLISEILIATTRVVPYTF